MERGRGISWAPPCLRYTLFPQKGFDRFVRDGPNIVDISSLGIKLYPLSTDRNIISPSANSQISENALKKDGCSTSGMKARADQVPHESS